MQCATVVLIVVRIFKAPLQKIKHFRSLKHVKCLPHVRKLITNIRLRNAKTNVGCLHVNELR